MGSRQYLQHEFEGWCLSAVGRIVRACWLPVERNWYCVAARCAVLRVPGSGPASLSLVCKECWPANSVQIMGSVPGVPLGALPEIRDLFWLRLPNALAHRQWTPKNLHSLTEPGAGAGRVARSSAGDACGWPDVPVDVWIRSAPDIYSTWQPQATYFGACPRIYAWTAMRVGPGGSIFCFYL